MARNASPYRYGWRLWLLTIGLAAIGGGAGLWLGKPALFPDLTSRAASAYSQGDFRRADRLARQRLKEAPEDPEALRLAARTEARQGRDQAAIAIYRRLELRRMAAEDYFLLGRALSRTGQDELAEKSLEASLAADPGRPETWEALAPILARRDRSVAAEDLAERLARAPGWEVRGLMMLGTFRAQNQDPAGAAQALRRAFALDPDGKAAAPQPPGPLRLLLARCLLQLGRPVEARRILQAIAGSGSDPQFAWLLSRCFLQEKAWAAAAAALEAARSYREDYPLDPEPASYVGAARCGSCHRSNYQSVMASRHARTFSRPRDPRALTLPDHPVPDPADPQVSHTFQAAEDGIRAETRVRDQVFRALGHYAFGSPDHYVTLVGPDEQGRPRLLRISAYHSRRGSGWDISTGLERHPTDRADWLGKPIDSRDGERRCLSCHTTNFRSIVDRAGPEATDQAIGCEACHGPGGNHVLAIQAHLPDPAIVVARRSRPEAINQGCARCHGLTQIHQFAAADDDPGWLRFPSITMSRSRCYTASGEQIHCVTCHDPHTNAETAPASYEAKCLDCHGPRQTTCPVNPAQGCIACHMPRIWVPATHAFKADHNIRVHSRPDAGNPVHR
jgi:tetratricopeptide (TPR) repeat protein